MDSTLPFLPLLRLLRWDCAFQRNVAECDVGLATRHLYLVSPAVLVVVPNSKVRYYR